MAMGWGGGGVWGGGGWGGGGGGGGGRGWGGGGGRGGGGGGGFGGGGGWGGARGRGAGMKLVVGGSTGRGEEGAILAMYQELRGRFGEMRLAIVPRHPEVVGQVVAAIGAAGLVAVRRTDR